MIKTDDEERLTAEEPSEESLNFIISGGISGAITDPYSKEGREHAKRYYELVRSFSKDIDKIAHNTGYSHDQIALIKHYLFYMLHDLGDEWGYFDASLEIAQSWQRLALHPKDIKPHDLTLLKHERREIEILCTEDSISQSDAHTLASKDFNYQEESRAFYRSLKKKNH